MGVPVVSSRHAGIPEIFQDGETGLLARERDHEALGEYLLRYLRAQEFWQASRARDVPRKAAVRPRSPDSPIGEIYEQVSAMRENRW